MNPYTVKANNNTNSCYSFVKSLLFRMIKQIAHNDKFSDVFFKIKYHQIYFQDKAKDAQKVLSLIFH